MGAIQPVGELLRDWRRRRRLSREMVLRLAEHLEVPGHERNALPLLAEFTDAMPAPAAWPGAGWRRRGVWHTRAAVVTGGVPA